MGAALGVVGVEDSHGGGMAMQFTRVVNPVADMEIWNASSDGFSFVISYESRSGPGFHGPPGYAASCRSLSQNTGAIRVAGSPIKTLVEAEEACARPCWDTWRQSPMGNESLIRALLVQKTASA